MDQRTPPPVSAFAVSPRVRGIWLAFLRVLAGARILAFPGKLKQLQGLRYMKEHLGGAAKRDTFFFLTHDHYLSRTFTLPQRIDCAMDHYRFERENYGPGHLSAVYRLPKGLVLWERLVNDVSYRIVLLATEDLRYEGDLSVLCFVNDTRVCRVSFSYINAGYFGLRPGHTIFITRNQTDRNAALELFRASFKQNSPPYFCWAAVCGVAMANGMGEIMMVKEQAQIAYAERYAEGFRNSYSALWEALGAEEIPGHGAYRMSIPLNLTPLSQVSHRSRTANRRGNWLEIALSAARAMLENRTSDSPAPIANLIALLPPASDSRGAPRQPVPAARPARPASRIRLRRGAY